MLKTTSDDLATTYFFNQFTASNGHWHFLRDFARQLTLNPVLDMVIRACGTAALDNLEGPVLVSDKSEADRVNITRLIVSRAEITRAHSTLKDSVV